MPHPYFHKLILSSTIQAKELRIPENFANKFRDEFSAVATLSLPDGHVWQVGLKRIGNSVWFHNGWQKFVERYSIRVGYFLIFRYGGNSRFFVHIYNLPASEISYQSNALGGTHGLIYGNQYNVFEQMEDDDSAAIMGSSLPCLTSGPLKNKLLGECGDQLTPSRSYTPPSLQNLFNGSQLKNCLNWAGERNPHPSKGVKKSPAETEPTRNVGVQFNSIEFKRSLDEVKFQSPDQETQIKKTMRKKRKPDPNEQESSVQHEEVEMRFRFYESASARKRTVTAEERERAINAAKAFEPANPFCRVVLRPSYLYRGCIMYLPSCFAEKNLSGVSGFIKLQVSDGRQWPVRCLYKGGRAKLSQGWYEFSLENNLGEGDVCVFEMLRTRDIVLKVTPFRVLDNTGLVVNHPLQQNVGQTKFII
ncbi:hypothetical protein I3843_06G132900 [Carya illinoinensis]|uniref:TF-B3 domain-containing protein n=1 Tax=Carya illinoinensis TaxID=32201 RepID=A0A922EWS8_CARIL|nr:hypothetical protein I3842_06G140200 [Carya illinoinensis]KAG7976119.1 hypothetical protein I3843_06G132900 [Carya illinoinensis]